MTAVQDEKVHHLNLSEFQTFALRDDGNSWEQSSMNFDDDIPKKFFTAACLSAGWDGSLFAAVKVSAIFPVKTVILYF
jgi:hypothetical protein